MTLSGLAKIVNGQLMGEDKTFTGLSTDTRSLRNDEVFVAIKGENFNGHDFLATAKEQGAAAAIVSDDVAHTMNLIKVADTRLALGAFAKYHREQFAIPVIAVTGSCGKTTTKSMMAAILKKCGEVLANQGTFNNDIGVPLTLLQIEAKHEFAVVEMGMNHFGEIRYITQLAKPTVALITNVAPAHLQGVGTIEGVAKAKAEIFEGLSVEGTAIINADDQFADYWRQLLAGKKIISFGINNKADFYATDIGLDAKGCAHFNLICPLGTTHINLPVLGKHNVMNALAAAAATYAAGASLDAIKQGLETITAVNKRLVQYEGKRNAQIIDDTYNANPLSFQAALQILSNVPGKKMLVLGDMGELGNDAEKYHFELGKQAKQMGIDELYAYGKLSKQTADAFGQKAHYFSDQEQLIAAVEQALADNMTVLVKGSRSMRMENVVQNLIKIKN